MQVFFVLTLTIDKIKRIDYAVNCKCLQFICFSFLHLRVLFTFANNLFCLIGGAIFLALRCGYEDYEIMCIYVLKIYTATSGTCCPLELERL